ncbi:hypothetical protein D3C73_1455910 [compost metagenome]
MGNTKLLPIFSVHVIKLALVRIVYEIAISLQSNFVIVHWNPCKFYTGIFVNQVSEDRFIVCRPCQHDQVVMSSFLGKRNEAIGADQEAQACIIAIL